MPTFNDRDIEKKDSQQALSGLYISAGEIIHGDFDSKDWLELQDNYTKIRNGDPMASTSIDILKYPILNSERMIEPGMDTPKALEAVKYVNWVYDNMKKGFQYLKRHKLLGLDFGLSMHEIVKQRGVLYPVTNQLTTVIEKMVPFMNETIDEFHYDQFEEFIGIRHERRMIDSGSEFINIPADKLDWFTYNEEFEDIRGRAIYRQVRLATESKQKIIIASVRGIQRGTGIPILETEGTPSGSDKEKLKQIARSLTQSDNPYLTYDKKKINLRLESIQSQQDVSYWMDFFNREIMYNTLSQFVLSGIGGNGSRAATSEHKGSYELSAHYILKELESNFQVTTDKIMGMSYLADLPREEWPIFRLSAITQIDLSKVAANLKTLGETSIVNWSEEDERIIRDQFGLPAADPSLVIEKKPEDEPEEGEEIEEEVVVEEPSEEKQEEKPKEKELEIGHTRELRKSERDIFELESAKNHFGETKDKIESNMQEMFDKVIDDISSQLRNTRTNKFRVRFFDKFLLMLMGDYKKAVNKGQSDVKKELNKIAKQKQLEFTLETEDQFIEKKKKRVHRKLSKLYKDTENRIASVLEDTPPKKIKENGITKITNGFKLEMKLIRRDILDDVTGGYIDGRGIELDKGGFVLEYSAILDNNICQVCAPLDGFEFTVEEVQAKGLQFKKPTNPECEGGSSCRCVLIPVEEI